MRNFFKYYKRGSGELDTSNFPDIIESREVTVEKLDEKTFMSLLALQDFMDLEGYSEDGIIIDVNIEGYVAHMRSGKDTYGSYRLYDYLENMNLICHEIQHESLGVIKSGELSYEDVIGTFSGYGSVGIPLLVGADKLVHKFMPSLSPNCCASKVRNSDGKIESVEIPKIPYLWAQSMVIVDDILEDGHTIQMFVDNVAKICNGKLPKLFLWCAYNEGIHEDKFLDQFEDYYIGDLI